MNGAQQIVGGLLAYCFTLIGGDKVLKSWQALFLSYGVLSVFWGLFVIWYMPDSPMRAKCFSEEDKHLMIERLRSNQTGIQNKEFRSYQVWEALRDPQTWCYCSIQIFTTLPTSGLGAFAGIIMTGFNFTTLQSQLLAMVLGFYIIVILLTSAWLVKKYNQNLLVMLGFVIPYVHPRFSIGFSLMCLQFICWNYRVDDSCKHYAVHQSWPVDQLLHHPVLLVRSNTVSLYGVSKCCRTD